MMCYWKMIDDVLSKKLQTLKMFRCKNASKQMLQLILMKFFEKELMLLKKKNPKGSNKLELTERTEVYTQIENPD